MAADGGPHGCYKPFALPLGGGAVQIYFADETPYEKAKCAWQNISFVETADGGKTWGEAKIAAYTPERRDGMPVVMDFGKWRYLAIEANPGKTRLHPQIVKCPMRGVSTPPGMVVGKDSMLWNSLCPLGDDVFLLVSQVKGRITVYPGRVSGK